MHEGSEFAARVYAAINARDREVIRALRDGLAIRLQSFAHHDDAVRYARAGGAA